METKLYELALEASRAAYAPYSNFKVGAAILLSNGDIVTGSNQENASYALCLCAERVALASTASRYPNGGVIIERMAVASSSTDKMVSPCGACRQVLIESSLRQGHEIIIEMGDSENRVSRTTKELLPLAFEL